MYDDISNSVCSRRFIGRLCQPHSSGGYNHQSIWVFAFTASSPYTASLYVILVRVGVPRPFAHLFDYSATVMYVRNHGDDVIINPTKNPPFLLIGLRVQGAEQVIVHGAVFF